MIGPLAKADAGAYSPPDTEPPPPAGGGTAATFAPAGAEPPDEWPVARCAAIAASIARARAETPRILEENELTPAAWAALTRRYSDAIREEAMRGRDALLRAYDRAYVAQIERERGPIQVEEYARLAVAAERGAEGPVLAELGLPHAALIRIERVWIERMSSDPELRQRAREAIDAERELNRC
jgi:hypothetical protein